jgi:anti-anti-sigma factor
MSIRMRTDETGVLWLAGDLDFGAFGDFLAVAEPMVDGKDEFVVDLSEVGFMDSTGIRALIILAGKISGVLVVRRPAPSVRRALGIAGIEGPGGIRIDD